MLEPNSQTSLLINSSQAHYLPTKFEEQIKNYISASKSEATLKAYKSALRIFKEWCSKNHILEPFPASSEIIAAFISDRAPEKSVSTLQKYLSAIGEAHRMKGFKSPTMSFEIKTLLKGIRRKHGTAPKGKAPLLVRHLRSICEVLPRNSKGHRDRALLLLGFAGALRRSELVGLNFEDLDFREEGLIMYIRKSKTDQEGRGRQIGIPFGSNPSTCPVRAVRTWLEVLGEYSGPIFRSVTRHGEISKKRLSGRAVGLTVKYWVEVVGLDPYEFGGHSLRAGLATEAARNGLDAVAISRQTGHKSLNTLRGYIRHGTLFVNNPAAVVGL